MTKNEVAITVTYEDVELLIYHTINKFHAKWGGDREAYESEANEVFLKVYEQYDPDRGAFSTLLVTSLIRRFGAVRNFHHRRRSVWQKSIEFQVAPGLRVRDIYSTPDGGTALDELNRHLSEDAAQVVEAVTSSVNGFADLTVDTAQNLWRQSMREHFVRAKEWSSDQLDSACEEISTVLGRGSSIEGTS